jgi:hypothetical protein
MIDNIRYWYAYRTNRTPDEFDEYDSHICDIVAAWSKENKSEINNSDWSECKCKDCGYTWNASDTEHFNISFCNSCHGTNIGGKYYEQEDNWSDIYDAFLTAIEESGLQGTTKYHDLENETHTLAEECKRIHEVMLQRNELTKAALHLLNLHDNPIKTTRNSWSKQITLAYEELRKAIVR